MNRVQTKHVLIVAAFIILGFGVYIVVSKSPHFTEAQNANKALFDKAVKNKDPSLCAGLSGETPYPQLGPNDESLGLQLVDEGSAKKMCVDNARVGHYYRQ